MRARLRAFQAALAGLPALICYAVKANSNLAVIRLLRRARAPGPTRSPAARSRGRSRPACRRRRIVYAGDRQDRRRDPHARSPRHPAVQRRIRAGAVPALARSRPDMGADRARGAAGQPRRRGRRRTTRSAPGAGATSSGSRSTEVGEVYAMAARLAGIEPVGLHLHIGSQITDARAVRRRLPPRRRAVPRACARPASRCAGSISAAASACATGTSRGSTPDALGALVRRVTAGLDAELCARARPRARRRGRRAAVLGDLPEGDGGAALPGARLRHGRPRPAGDVRCLPRRRAGPRAGARGRRCCAMDVVGPICESSDVLGARPAAAGARARRPGRDRRRRRLRRGDGLALQFPAECCRGDGRRRALRRDQARRRAGAAVRRRADPRMARRRRRGRRRRR